MSLKDTLIMKIKLRIQLHGCGFVHSSVEGTNRTLY